MYAKLFASLYQGTLRGRADEILVFTNLLAYADATGLVDKHWRAISEEVGISEDRVKIAIANLEAPDPESRSPEYDGCRIIPVDEHRSWGWRIVNIGKYRSIKNEDDRREYNRLAQQKWREKHKTENDNDRNIIIKNRKQNKQLSTQVDIEVEEEEVSSTFVDSSSLRSEESTNFASSGSQRTGPSEPEAPGEKTPEPDGSSPPARKKTAAASAADVNTVFQAWRIILGKRSDAVLDDKRKKPIRDRLKDFTVEQLCRVPLGAKYDKWTMGDNDRKTKYDDVERLFRSAKHVEQFLAIADQHDSGVQVPVTDEDKAEIAAQKACGCYHDFGRKMVIQDGKPSYVKCDHSVEAFTAAADIVIPISEPVPVTLETPKAVWPPPVQ